MKKIIQITMIWVIVFMALLSHAQTQEGLTSKDIPKKVLKAFSEKNQGSTDVIWFPYPNKRSNKSEDYTIYFPILWDNHLPNFYEVQFNDENGKIRKVYGRNGNLLITSRPMRHENIPNQITEQLTEKGFQNWKKVSVEKVVKSGVQGSFYKIWLKDKKKKRILFFDDSFKLVKTLKWDDDTNFVAEQNTKLKNAPGVTKRKVASTEVPDKVKSKVKKNHVDIEEIEWFIHTRVYDPFKVESSNYSYYDIEIPILYQLIYYSKKRKYKVTYNYLGELLEIAEVLHHKLLPESVKKSLKSSKYASWKFAKEHDKIEVDDNNFVYRINGDDSGSPVQLILDEKGNTK